MSRRHKPNAYALRHGFERVASPSAPETIHTDEAGDRLDVSAAGKGRILVEIVPADPDAPAASVEIPEHLVLNLVGAAVRASQKTPEQLRARYQAHQGQ